MELTQDTFKGTQPAAPSQPGPQPPLQGGSPPAWPRLVPREKPMPSSLEPIDLASRKDKQRGSGDAAPSQDRCHLNTSNLSSRLQVYTWPTPKEIRRISLRAETGFVNKTATGAKLSRTLECVTATGGQERPVEFYAFAAAREGEGAHKDVGGPTVGPWNHSHEGSWK